MRLTTALIIGAVLALFATSAQAQVVNNPKAVSFTADDATMAKSLGVHVDFFACASLDASSACVGQAAAPFQAGVDIPLPSVTLLAPVDQFGNNRQVSLTAAPASGLLASVPSGQPFVAQLFFIGDANQGAANSPRSAASNPFFSGLKALAAPTGTRAK
jgi:hypothetical protein